MNTPTPEQIVALGKTSFRNAQVTFGIKQDDRRRHVYLIGKTGMGKTTCIENMAIQDVRMGNGLALVDPHGDMAEKVIDFIPPERMDDVIYFNPADGEWPIAFNVFERVEYHQRHLVSSGLVGVFKKLWAESWGPRLEYLLRNAILALLDYPDSTLLGVNRLLVDKAYRNKVIEHIEDPVVKAFWVDEYSKYPDKFQVEAIAPIQNKVGQFLSTPLIRNIVGQVESKLSMRTVMDEGKILILNLSKGRIGEDASSLLGAMIITKIQLAAMSRVDMPEEERRDFYLYVDEFQNFSTESFANILSEARKYRLDLILGHQYVEQLDEIVQAAIFGNVGTLIAYRVGATDAEFLAKEFQPYFTEEDLVNLPKFEVYMKLMIDGIASDPFSAHILPPISGAQGSASAVIEASRKRYGTPRDQVTEAVRTWSEAGREPVGGAKAKKPKEMHKTVCWHCGKDAEVPFKPDGKRPILCDDCLEKSRKGEIGQIKGPPPKARQGEGGSGKSGKKPSPKELSLKQLARQRGSSGKEFAGKPRIVGGSSGPRKTSRAAGSGKRPGA